MEWKAKEESKNRSKSGVERKGMKKNVIFYGSFKVEMCAANDLACVWVYGLQPAHLTFSLIDFM